MELEAQIGRDVGVRLLLVRQVDVQADALGADFERAAVGGFHDARPAAGHDHEVAAAFDLAGAGHEPAELAGLVVEVALGQHPLGALDARWASWGSSGDFLAACAGRLASRPRPGRAARSACRRTRRPSTPRWCSRSSVSVFSSSSCIRTWPIFRPLEKVEVVFGQPIAGRIENRLAIGLDGIGLRFHGGCSADGLRAERVTGWRPLYLHQFVRLAQGGNVDVQPRSARSVCGQRFGAVRLAVDEKHRLRPIGSGFEPAQQAAAVGVAAEAGDLFRPPPAPALPGRACGAIWRRPAAAGRGCPRP